MMNAICLAIPSVAVHGGIAAASLSILVDGSPADENDVGSELDVVAQVAGVDALDAADGNTTSVVELWRGGVYLADMTDQGGGTWSYAIAGSGDALTVSDADSYTARRVTDRGSAMSGAVDFYVLVPLYLYAGQSNGTGSALISGHTAPYNSVPYSGSLYTYQLITQDVTEDWAEMQGDARNPIASAPRRSGGELSFAKDLIDAGETFAIIKYTKDGTSLHLIWRPAAANTIYPAFLAFVQAKIASIEASDHIRLVPRALLWVQGEGDAEQSVYASSYQTNLAALLSQLQSDLAAPTLRVIFNRLSINDDIGEMPYRDTVRTKQEALAAADATAILVDSDSLPLADTKHFTAQGYEDLGRIFAGAERQYLAGTYPYRLHHVTSAAGGDSLVLAYSALTFASGDLLIASLVSKKQGSDNDATPATPSGWTFLAKVHDGYSTFGVDSGKCTTSVFYRIADGTESGNVTFGSMGAGGLVFGGLASYRKGAGTWSVAATTASQTTPNSASWATTGGADPGIQLGDIVLVVNGANGNGAANVSASGEYLTVPGCFFGVPVERRDAGTNQGNDALLFSSGHKCLVGVSTGAPAYAATIANPFTNGPCGGTVFVRIRAA